MTSLAKPQTHLASSTGIPLTSVTDILDQQPRLIRRQTGEFIRPQSEPQAFIEHELDVDTLDSLGKWLWVAGRVDTVRPLHHQRLLGRNISLTERAKAHLVWTEDKIFVKPLPDWLLHKQIWETYIPEKSKLRIRANCFLRTYLLLIQYESDFVIAKDIGLVPQRLEWNDWLRIVDENQHLILLDSSSRSPRYVYGELRLYRINLLYRFLPPWRLHRMFRGYLHGSANYRGWMRRNFAWLLIVFVYITILLTAMQLGLATPELANNKAFHRASYGFAIFSIFLPLAVIIYALTLSATLVAYHISTTLTHVQTETSLQAKIGQSSRKTAV